LKHVLLLSQEDIDLSSYEAVSLLEIKRYAMNSNLLLCNINNNNLHKISRLAYTRKVFGLLFDCKSKDIHSMLLQYDWSKIYKENFCLRIHVMEPMKDAFDEGEYARFIWRSLVKKGISPNVDLENPATLIELFIFKKITYVCRLIHENVEHYDDRKAHMKPALHPTAMHPKMAKGLVNILNPRNGEVIIDPFCGAGGILLEAALMNIKSIGYDIDRPMLNRARINLMHYKINLKLYKLINKDALSIKNFRNIVTDLPYGKSSKKSGEISRLYSRFIRKISARSVVVFPDFVDYKKLLKINLSKKLKIKKIISYYVHKTLTREIVMIDKKKY